MLEKKEEVHDFTLSQMGSSMGCMIGFMKSQYNMSVQDVFCFQQ